MDAAPIALVSRLRPGGSRPGSRRTCRGGTGRPGRTSTVHHRAEQLGAAAFEIGPNLEQVGGLGSLGVDHHDHAVDVAGGRDRISGAEHRRRIDDYVFDVFPLQLLDHLLEPVGVQQLAGVGRRAP